MTPDTRSLKPLADRATALLKALAHPVRLTVCCQLREAEMSVGEMEARLGLKQPGLSRELAKLRDEGLVETRRESKVIFYRLGHSPSARAMIEAVCVVMLDKAPVLVPLSGQVEARAEDTPKLRPNSPGGYGVFARTGA